MPVFALYNFNDNASVLDSAGENGLQNGIYLNGASASGGDLVLDGVNDFVKIYPSSEFQLDRGTLEVNFTTGPFSGGASQTVISRDSVGENQGSYRVEVAPDGSVTVTHELEGASETYTTGPGFFTPGDTVNLTYSWDQGGTGGTLQIDNSTTGTSFDAPVPATLTMDMADQSQPWFVGAGQSASDPDALNNIDGFFSGSVEVFSLSDTVDNIDNDTPAANPDTATTPEDTTVVIDVLANDTDPTGQTLTVTSATATNGTVTINPDGTVSYTPNADYNGSDQITYTVTDPDGNTDTSTVAVTVTPVNDDPVANPDTASTATGTPVVIDVTGNDTDVDGDPLSVVGTPASADGTVVVNPDGTITFTPDAGFTGTSTITYTVDDGNGGTDEGTVTVTVGDVDTPVANPDTATTPEDTTVVIDVLANDTDPTGQTLTVTGGSAPNGTVSVNPDGTISYTPNPDFNGPDEITYSVTDPDGNTATSTVTVTVTPVNDAPVAGDDAETIAFNTPVTLTLLGNDTDVDGDTLSVQSVGTSADGTVTLNGDGTVTFTPTDGFQGVTTFDYTITDGNGGTDTATVTITVEDRPRDGIVRGTDAGEVIDTTYIDPFDADRVDANDAIIPGDAANDDRIVAGGGNDSVYAGLGDDTVNGDLGDDLVEGGTGNDELRGNEGSDTLLGGEGSDTVFGQQDADLIDTSSSLQRPDIDYPGVYPADTDIEDDRDLVYGGLGNDTIRTGDDRDTIYGDDGRDLIDAGVDADLVYGGQGGDEIVGSEGADTIFGDTGSDLIYGGLNDVIGDALDIPDASGDLRPLNNTDLIYGGTGDDTIYGRDDDDTMYGGVGADVIYGGVDEDSAFGDTGNDTLFGGAGADTLAGGADRDVFVVGSEADGAGDFIDGNEEGDDFDTLDLTGAGRLRVTFSDDNPEDGRVDFLDADGNVSSTLNFVNIENVIPCFTPGTLIATPKGEVLAEHLRVGDKVITRDNGIQEIRWLGAKDLTWQDFCLNPHLKPVLVKRGSLGNGLPEQDMMVSPNHRLLVANDRTALYFDEHEVLVSAKHLVGSAGVQAVESMGTSYIHFMFDRHEVVLSNGAWTESFQPGDYTLKGMGNAQRSEIFELFPELKTEDGLDSYTAARRTLKKHEARLLVK